MLGPCDLSRGRIDLSTTVAAIKPDVSPFSVFRSVLNALALEDYRKNHWPNLEKAIDRLLLHNPTDHISVSYAQIYR